MPSRRPSPRRPPLSAPRGQLRAAYRLTAGMSPAQAGPRRGRGASRRSTRSWPSPTSRSCSQALAEMEELPEAERLRRLEQMAWHVLEMALADGDWRAAAFIADQMRRGCNPARSLAQSVVDAQARAAAARPGMPFQLAVADLAAVTGLDFGPLAAFDPLAAATGRHEFGPGWPRRAAHRQRARPRALARCGLARVPPSFHP